MGGLVRLLVAGPVGYSPVMRRELGSGFRFSDGYHGRDDVADDAA